MLSRSSFLTLTGAALAGGGGQPASQRTEAERIFQRAKEAWLRRVSAPFMTYGLRERYVWRDRPHENWWRASARSADHQVVLRRVIQQAQEEERLKGMSINLHVRFHARGAHIQSLDTNPDADAFPVLDPIIEPSYSFGMVHRGAAAALVGAASPASDASAPATPDPTALPTAAPTPTTGLPQPEETPLREVSRVEVFVRDYSIVLAGTETLPAGEAYHLVLTPLHYPKVYRLRDLWVATDSYATLQLGVAGIFNGKPYEDVHWTVTYVPINGQYYIQQVRADEMLRFGYDRKVSDFALDFVDYSFPSTLPDYLFRKLLF